MNLEATAARARLGHWLPGLRTIRACRRSWLGHDVVAGLVIVTLLVPASMGYAEAAGLPAMSGLYATIVPLLIERIGADRFYRTVGEAVHAYVDTSGVAWTDWEDRT